MFFDQEKDPIALFDKWYSEAEETGMKNPDAMSLATASKTGIPSNRMVLLKDFSPEGFVFYTNLESHKGHDLLENPFVSLCFYWKETDKQIRIEGEAIQVSDEEADRYFDSRPLQSRIGAHVSKQSQPMDSSFDLIKEVTLKSVKLTNAPRPKFWSGFRVRPSKIEFWEEGKFRLHIRVLYSWKDGKWESEYLYP